MYIGHAHKCRIKSRRMFLNPGDVCRIWRAETITCVARLNYTRRKIERKYRRRAHQTVTAYLAGLKPRIVVEESSDALLQRLRRLIQVVLVLVNADAPVFKSRHNVLQLQEIRARFAPFVIINPRIYSEGSRICDASRELRTS